MILSLSLSLSIDCQTLPGTKSDSHRMLEFLNKFISQLVSEPTRKNNLVIASQDHLINNAAVGENFGSCDHKLICANISTRSNGLEKLM